MIDPINSIPIARLTQSDSLNSLKSSKKKEVSDNQSVAAIAKNTSIQDRISLSFDLKGDLEKLSQSVATVQQEIKSQLENYFGILKEDGKEADPSRFQPPEDASAQDLLDFYSPQNTANRIVDFATGFFSVYLQSHAEEETQDQVSPFTTLIGDAIKQGFDEAKEALGDLSGLDEISKNIDRTYGLVMEGLDQFRHEHFNELGLEPEKVNNVSDDLEGETID